MDDTSIMQSEMEMSEMSNNYGNAGKAKLDDVLTQKFK